MRLGSIKYLVREGFKNVWVNGMMSIASVLVMVCCLILTGGAVLFSANISFTLKSIESQNSITVYLEKDIVGENSKIVGDKIKKISNVSSCNYYSGEEALNEYKDMLGDLFSQLEGSENPLPDAFHVTMDDLALYNETVSNIKAVPGVASVSDRSETAQKLTDLNRLVSTGGVWIVLSLGAVSLFIISNTIKVTMYNRRFEINIMKSVGATNWFIRIPFLIEGVVIGLISAIIATATLKFAYDELMSVVDQIIPFNWIVFSDIILYVFLGFAISGVFFGLIGGLISISRYLKKEGGDVVAW